MTREVARRAIREGLRAERKVDDSALNTKKSAGRGMNGLPRPEGSLLYRKGPKSAVMANIFQPDDGSAFLDIRQWVKTERAGGWIRTMKGVSIPINSAPDFQVRLKRFIAENI